MACFIVHIQQGLNADEISEKVKGWMEERLVNTPTPGQIEGWLILAVVVSWIGLGWVGKGRGWGQPNSVTHDSTTSSSGGAGWSDEVSQITFRPLSVGLLSSTVPYDCDTLPSPTLVHIEPE